MSLSTSELEQVFTPWVMRSAWEKVQRWYGFGEPNDPAEYLDWQSDPWRHLSELAHDLIQGRYHPSPFPAIPYPKNGDRTRHFLLPSVRDQVAFMALVVVLGPFYEGQMPNVSFGNRLYRPRVMHKGRWYSAPFSLQQTALYDPFSSGYGLFRRLLQWLVDSAVLSEEELGSAQSPQSDVEVRRLPFAAPKAKPSGNLLYARVDLSLAYPSVDRDSLAAALEKWMGMERPIHSPAWGLPSFPKLETTTDESEALFAVTYERPRQIGLPDSDRGTLPGQPWSLLAANKELRTGLAKLLGDLLKETTYVWWTEPTAWSNRDLTAPCEGVPSADLTPEQLETQHDTRGVWPADCHLPETHLRQPGFGLPTGLAASGLLLNVALTQLDRQMCAEFDQGKADERVWYLRFVDDIFLFAQNQEALERGLRTLIRELRLSSEYFHLGTHKAEPASVKDYLTRVAKLPDKELDRERLRVTPSDWLTRSNAKMFTTTVVEELSGLAEESLEESFGALGVERLNHLLELAGRADEDLEVGTDARISFAVNKMARNFWPADEVFAEGQHLSPETYARRILLSAERSLKQHPWRFKLWKSTLVIALRASAVCYRGKSGEGPNEDLGFEWLRDRILPLIAWSAASSTMYPSVSWEMDDLRSSDPKVNSRRTQHRRLRTSFHRGWFWRQWSSCVRALRAVAEGKQQGWANESWTTFFSQKEAAQCLTWFGNLPTWASVIYRSPGEMYWGGERPFLWWWEGEALRDAMLAFGQVTVEHFAFLSAPRRERLRTETWDTAFIEGILATSDPNDNTFADLRQALNRVLTLAPARDEMDAVAPLKRRTVLWLTRARYTPNELPAMITKLQSAGLCPVQSANTLDWAAVARMGLWSDWAALHTLRLSTKVPLKADEFWRQFRLLDAYGYLRRLLLAHGQLVTWHTFRNWFPQFQPKTDAKETRPSNTLLEALYRLDQQKAPAEAMVPAVELEATTAFYVGQAVNRRHGVEATGIVTPDTVLLEEVTFTWLTKSRTHLVQPEQKNRKWIDLDREVIRPLIELQTANDDTVVRVGKFTSQSRAPHPLFLYPELLLGQQRRHAEQWRTALLLLWMLAGGEELLDWLWRTAPWQPSLYDRDDLRTRFVMPESMWRFLETGLGTYDLTQRDWSSSLDSLLQEELSPEEVEVQIKLRDVFFQDDGSQLPEMSVQPVRLAAPPAKTTATRTHLKELRARLVQGVAQPGGDVGNWAMTLAGSKTYSHRREFEEIGDELADRLREARANAEVRGKNRHPDHIIIMPEWYIPPSWLSTLKVFVRETGIAVLGGLVIREVPRAVPVVPKQKTKGLRLLVNEAVLLLPDRSVAYADALLKEDPKAARARHTRVYTFRMRKPFPSANERGLLRALSAKNRSSRWGFLPGTQWYRWTYPFWGSFSVAICSDLLDTFVWDWLRGRIQHLFIPAWNEDVRLFDELTWTRGYELFTNVASVNHGTVGGTLAWSPQRKHARELFSVYGAGHGLSATVALPVESLIKAQDGQLEASIRKTQKRWSKPEKKKSPEYRTPAPNYRHEP